MTPKRWNIVKALLLAIAVPSFVSLVTFSAMAYVQYLGGGPMAGEHPVWLQISGVVFAASYVAYSYADGMGE